MHHAYGMVQNYFQVAQNSIGTGANVGELPWQRIYFSTFCVGIKYFLIAYSSDLIK